MPRYIIETIKRKSLTDSTGIRVGSTPFDIPEKPGIYDIKMLRDDGVLLDAGKIECPEWVQTYPNSYYLKADIDNGKQISSLGYIKTPYWHNLNFHNVELENTSLNSTVTYSSDKIKKGKLTRSNFIFLLEFTNHTRTIQCSTDDIHEEFKQTLSITGTVSGSCTATVSLEDGYLQLTVSGDSYVADGEWDAELGEYDITTSYIFKKASISFFDAYQYY